MMNNEPLKIKRSNLVDEVAGLLQQKISLGEFQPGDKLPPEPELMKIFGIGRSTLREAIRILSNAQIVKVQQGLGTFVAPKSTQIEPFSRRLQRAKGTELNEVRQLLELKIAQKAALNRTPENLKKMKQYLNDRHQMALANNAEKCIEADILFHQSIAEASGNAILADLYDTVAANLKTYFMEIYITTEPFLQTQDLHEALLQSILDQNATLAWERALQITNFSDLN